MKLDRSTYEAWLLDRMEGNLTAEQEAELRAFLLLNPDLDDDLPGSSFLDDAPIRFPEKDLLKRQIPPMDRFDPAYLEDFLIARGEGDLDPAQFSALEAYLVQHPEIGRVQRLIAAARIRPASIPFPDKEELRRSIPPTGLPDEHRVTDFLIAAQEGDLDPAQLRALEAYLAQHPEAERAERLIAAARIRPTSIPFPGQEALHRTIPPTGLPDKHRLTDFLIASMEGDLDARQAAALDRLILGDASAQRERALVQASRIQPGTEVFATKAALYKERVPRVIPLWQRLAIAASLLIAVTVAVRFAVQPTGGGPSVAVTTPTLPSTPIPPSRSEEALEQGTDATPDGSKEDQAAPSLLDAQGKTPVNGTDNAPKGTMRQVTPGTEVPADVLNEGQDAQPAPAVVAPTPPPMPEPTPEVLPLARNDEQEATPGQAGGGTSNTLGTLFANTVRNEVLGTTERPQELDRRDAVAMVDKGLSALTNGEGGMEVQRVKERKRVFLRLGGNFEIMASSGR